MWIKSNRSNLLFKSSAASNNGQDLIKRILNQILTNSNTKINEKGKKKC